MNQENQGPINPLEVDLEVAIQEAYLRDPEIVRSKGLRIYGHMLRQPELTGYGIPDLLTWYISGTRMSEAYDGFRIKGRRTLYIDIIELKRDLVKLDHVVQVCRYMRGVTELLRASRLGKTFKLEISGHLIGRSIDFSQDLVFVTDMIPRLTLYTWSLDLEHGIRFTTQQNFRSSGQDVSRIEQYIDSLNPKDYHRGYYEYLMWSEPTPDETRSPDDEQA